MSASDDDLTVKFVDEVGDGRGRTRGDLADRADAVLFIAGVDTLRAITRKEILVEFQAGDALKHGYAVFLGGARIDRGFIDHDVAALERRADRFAGLDQWIQVGLLVLVDRRRDSHDEHVGFAQIPALGGEAQPGRLGEFGGRHLKRVIMATRQLFDAGTVDIEADHGALLSELHGKRQPDIAKTNDCELHVLNLQNTLQQGTLRMRNHPYGLYRPESDAKQSFS